VQTGRKGLYQVLVEKELEEEKRAASQIGTERGMLGEAGGIEPERGGGM
jgi:hypothetical protein